MHSPLRWLAFGLSFLITVSGIVLFSSRAVLPLPLGKILDPFHGFWQNAETRSPAEALPKDLKLPGLKGKVTMQLDAHLIPHIFAENDHDLYYTQGYVTAWLRLWQMDMINRFAGGTLSEVIGPGGLRIDQERRRYGMQWAAEHGLEHVMKDSVTKTVLTAYAAGANAYISKLSYKDYPVEYKLLDFEPTPWSEYRTAMLLAYLAWDLKGDQEEWKLTNIAEQYGKEATEELFPNWPDRLEPIIPSGTKWDFTPLKVPPVPEEAASKTKALQPPPRNLAAATKIDDADFLRMLNEPIQGLGSNNWAVGPAKTASGNAMLAFDPHLRLNLPSIWLQMQLVAPGTNAYGVIIPGAPCIGVGFNEHIAWGQTNVAPDVVDFYRMRFKDASMKEYWYNGEWKPTTQRIEVIKVKGKADVLDTVHYTHHGPVAYGAAPDSATNPQPRYTAVRWTLYESINEIKTFYALNRARNYDEFLQAMRYWAVPAFNFAYADREKNIALWVNGRYPIKWVGQGKYMLDGSNPKHEWAGYIPHSHNPHVKNPARGYVSSANQHSADQTYPYYLQWDFYGFERGTRINERLATMHRITADSLRLLQADTKNLHAQRILPTMLSMTQSSVKEEKYRKCYDLVAKWDYHHEPKALAPTVFKLWYSIFMGNVFSDQLGGPQHTMPASQDVASLMLREIGGKGTYPWWDDVRTPAKETLQEMVASSFIQTVDSLHRKYGEVSEKWEWAKYKASVIRHMANLEGFSRPVFNGGDSKSLNAMGMTGSGPSWRMVVDMGKEVRAFGIYPGGQSGNPGSKFYDDFLSTWEENQLLPLEVLKEPAKEGFTTVLISKE